MQAAAFTGPMWGIHIAAAPAPAGLDPVAGHAALGMGHQLPPGTKTEPYVLSDPFEDNMLTTDPADVRHDARPDRRPTRNWRLGGPSYVWLREALRKPNIWP